MANDSHEMTDKEIVDLANELARKLYKSNGYDVDKGYRFDKASHPQERLMWHQAYIAFDLLKNTDIEDALSNIEEQDK